MPSLLPISTILQVADISQYLAAADISKGNAFKSGVLAPPLALQIFNAKTVVRWIYNLNPNDTSLTKTSNYLFQLLGSYAITAQRILANTQLGDPVITGPTSQTVSVGSDATFSVTVTGGASPLSYQWYDNLGNTVGTNSPTYVFPNAQITDTDKYFYVRVTDAHGAQAVSGQAFLTVTAMLVGYFAYLDADPGPDLQASNDPFSYQVIFNITHNSPLVITLPGASTPNKYLIVKVPIGESTKATWFNTPLNNGTIPDSVWQNFLQFNGWTYYYTRVAASMDTSQTLTLS